MIISMSETVILPIHLILLICTNNNNTNNNNNSAYCYYKSIMITITRMSILSGCLFTTLSSCAIESKPTPSDSHDPVHPNVTILSRSSYITYRHHGYGLYVIHPVCSWLPRVRVPPNIASISLLHAGVFTYDVY